MASSVNSTTSNAVAVGSPSQCHMPPAGNRVQQIHMKPATHLISQPNHQTQGGSLFPGHFQLCEPQGQVLTQPQYSHAQPQQSHGLAHTHSHSQAQGQPLPISLNPVGGSIGVSPPPGSTSVSGSNVKRVQQKPPPRPPGSSGTNTGGSPLKTMEVAPAPGRKKPKLPDKQVLERVAALVPESAFYAKLLELEGRIDATLSRKKIDVQEAIKNPHTIQKTLRIYVFNTFSNQDSADPGEGNPEPPSWTLKLVGRILENGVDSEASGTAKKEKYRYPEFSTFFKRITIYLDQGLYPDKHVILWDNSRSPTPREGFEVKRLGDKEFTVLLRLEMNYMPERFKLSPALMEVLGIEVDTQQRVLAALWHYVKVRKLQSPNDPSLFMCDPPLRKVFGEDKMKFSMVPQKLSHHLSPPQPIHLEHKIKLSGNCPAGTTCYDVLVDVPFLLEKDMETFLEKTENQKEIETFDETISGTIKKIQEHYRRHSFFFGFSKSPVDFVNALIASQSRDLNLAFGDASHTAEREGRSEFYSEPWAEDAVLHYLNRKTAAGSDGT